MLTKPTFRMPLFGRIWDAIASTPVYKTPSGKEFYALRLDLLAKALDTKDVYGLLKSINVYLESQRAGLLDQAFTLIPGRQQESYGFLQADFPRKEMPPMPDELKKRRVTKKKDAKDEGKSWYPILALDPDKLLARDEDSFEDINDILQAAVVPDEDGNPVRLFDVDGIRIILRKDGYLVTREAKPATKTE